MQTVSRAKVVEIIVHSEKVREYILELEKYRKFDEGSFLQLSLDLVDASEYWPESRTFSIASKCDRKNKRIRLIISKVGSYTTRIFTELVVGSECTVKYAFGDMILPSVDVPIICIAAGTGVAPFLSFIEKLEESGKLDNLKLYYSSKTKKELYHFEFLKGCLGSNLHCFTTREKIEECHNRRIAIEDILIDTDAEYYICGSFEFIAYFYEALSLQGIKKIHKDEWE